MYFNKINLVKQTGATYSWDNSLGSDPNPVALPGSTTTYTITATGSNGCTDTDDVVVTVDNSNPTANAGDDVSICNGSSTSLSASGGGSYSWSPTSDLDNAAIAGPSASPSSTETYTVTVTGSNGCTDTDDVVVTVVSSPDAGTLSGTQDLNPSSVVLLTSSGNPGGAWSSNNGFVTIDPGTGVATGVADGSSTITYTVSASPCTDATATIVLTVSNNYVTTGNNSNWSNTACWGGGVVPPSSGDVIISHDITVDASTNSLGTVTLDPSKTLTVATGQTIMVSGASDINGTLSIEGTGTFDANGNFDATSGTIDFTGAGTLKIGATVSSTTTSLGTLDAAAGTIWYDGGPLTIVTDDYYSLRISQPNTKTAAGTININGDLTLNSGATYSIGATTTTVTGTSVIEGTLELSTGIFDANGTYDATGGNTTFTDAGTLKLGSTVTDIGTFTRSTGTVEYDGGNQSVAGLNASSSASYYNLVINGSGTKTLAGTSSIYGDLTLTASDFDLDGNTIYPKNNITRTSGNLIAGSASSVTIDNSGSHDICAFNDGDITLRTTSTGGTVTTTGDITCSKIDLGSGSKTFIIDGETVNVETEIELTAGTLQLTAGALNINSNSATSAEINGGTLDIDGGTLTVGNSSLADITMSSGSIEVSGGTLNIVDELDVSNGTITQTGGTINIKSYVGSSSGTGAASKFEMDAGTLNLTAGTLRINGQTTSSPSSYPALSIAGGVTVNANTNHTTLIQSNNISSNDEDIYVNMNGNDLGNLTVNLSGHEVYLNSNVNVIGAMTVTAGEFALGTHTSTVTGTSDIDGTLSISTGTFDANGTFDATGGDVTFSGSGRLELGGTVTSLGTFTPGTSVVEYDGGAQTIDDFSGKSGPYNDLEIDGSGDKTLSGNTTVSNQLTFSADHDIIAGSHTLTITRTPIGYSNNRLIKNGDDANPVSVAYSSTSTSKCEIPVGIDGSHRMISLSAAGTSATTYTVAYTPGSPYGGSGTLFEWCPNRCSNKPSC